MKLTDNWIKKYEPCEEGVEWWDGKERDSLKILRKLIREKRYYWANWLIVRTMTYKQYVRYAVYAAEQVISNYEKEYPDDKRPRESIEAAKKCIKNPSIKNKDAAWSAARSAWSAQGAEAWSAKSAWSTAWSAARSAVESAAWSAEWSAESAAWSAARSAYWSAAAEAEKAMQLKILKYGMKLITQK